MHFISIYSGSQTRSDLCNELKFPDKRKPSTKGNYHAIQMIMLQSNHQIITLGNQHLCGKRYDRFEVRLVRFQDNVGFEVNPAEQQFYYIVTVLKTVAGKGQRKLSNCIGRD